MSKVFLLGAGASRELKFNISTLDAGYGTRKTDKFLLPGPLSNAYFYDANNFAQKVKSRLPISASLDMPSNLSQYICEYYYRKFGQQISKDDILNNETISRKINIETLYLHIEQEIMKSEKEGNDTLDNKIDPNDPFFKLSFIKDDLLKYIYRSLSLMCNYSFSIYHAILASYIINYGGEVISFNWDILLDEAMEYADKWSYIDGYGISFKDIIYKNEVKNKELIHNNSRNIILKPHGSINWYKKINGNDGLYLVVPIKRNLRGGTLDILKAYEYDKDKNQYFTSIVPPGMKRKAYPEVWTKIKEVLENADEIIAVGFSFNDNDEHVKEEFEEINFRQDLKISLINPNSSKVMPAYKEVFKTDNVASICDTLGNYCQWIVEEKMQELSPLLN